ncbi:MAG: exosortase/archaeosortase family protein [Opitutales bacterium]|nr:exosortase/archaeosortase family protein [Opitutales bacterium]
MIDKTLAILRREAIPIALYALAAAVFLPVISWLWRRTTTEEQLLHAFAVLVFALGVLIYEKRIGLRAVFNFGRGAGLLLLGALLLAIAATLTGASVLVLPGFVLALASALVYIFGTGIARFTAALLGAFSLYVLMALLLPLLDWPMRTLAAQGSARILGWFGKDAELALAPDRGEGPMLLLFANDHPFHVAAECNGFGVLTASLLLTLLLVLFKKVALFDKALLLAAAAVSGIVFNYLRIIVIVYLAPVVGLDNYYVMHEIVGVITYYGCLLFLWWMISGFGRDPGAGTVQPPAAAPA